MEAWKSPRQLAAEQAAREEAARQTRYRAFDHLVDMALNGELTLEEAIAAYQFNGDLYLVQPS